MSDDNAPTNPVANQQDSPPQIDEDALLERLRERLSKEELFTPHAEPHSNPQQTQANSPTVDMSEVIQRLDALPEKIVDFITEATGRTKSVKTPKTEPATETTDSKNEKQTSGESGKGNAPGKHKSFAGMWFGNE